MGLGLGSTPQYKAFDDLLQQVKQNLEAKVAEEAQAQDAMRRERHQNGGFPLLSCFVNDCISKGLDIDHGGARYDWIEMSFVGLANLAD